MHCKSCEMLVKEALQELDGVSKADASHAKNEINVEYDEKKISLDAIKSAIKKEGYGVL